MVSKKRSIEQRNELVRWGAWLVLFYAAALKWRQIYLQRRPRGGTVSTTMRPYPLGDSHPPRTLCDPSPSTPSWESPGKERGEGPLALDNETVKLPCVLSLPGQTSYHQHLPQGNGVENVQWRNSDMISNTLKSLVGLVQLVTEMGTQQVLCRFGIEFKGGCVARVFTSGKLISDLRKRCFPLHTD